MNNVGALDKLKHLFAVGIPTVLLANVINKVTSFVCNIVLVRIVTQTEFGTFTSANNIVSLAMLITGLGTLSGALQYGAENRDESEKNAYYKACFCIGLIFDLLLVVFIAIYVRMGGSPIQGANNYILLLLPTIVLHFGYEYLGTILRSQKKVKQYAKLLNVNSVLYSVMSCVGAAYSIEGLIFGRCIAYIISVILGLFFLSNRIFEIFHAAKLRRRNVKELLCYSISCCIIAALNRMLYYIDITIITYIVKQPIEIAVYRVGTQIPEAMEFIPSSILVAVIPYFALHNQDNKWLKKWTKKLYLYSAILNFGVTAVLIVFAPIIVNIFWGSQYIESVPVFRILSLNYFVMATFRQTGTNILSTLRRTNYNLFISVITGILNIFLDVILIGKYGIMGAAWATLIVVIVASLLSLPYVYYIIYKRGLT